MTVRHPYRRNHRPRAGAAEPARAPRPRLCELPDRWQRPTARSFSRLHNRLNGSTTYTVIFEPLDGGKPLYRWTRMEPGATRLQAARCIRSMRLYLAAKVSARILH